MFEIWLMAIATRNRHNINICTNEFKTRQLNQDLKSYENENDISHKTEKLFLILCIKGSHSGLFFGVGLEITSAHCSLTITRNEQGTFHKKEIFLF